METQAHIKIGRSFLGKAIQIDDILVTQTYKNAEGEFEVIEVIKPNKKGEQALEVSFASIYPMDSVSIGNVSFVIINEKYKYMAIEKKQGRGGVIYLKPIQPNYDNPEKPLPVIKLGKSSDWAEKLELKTRLWSQFVYNGLVVDFKSESAHTIESFKEALEKIEDLPIEVYPKLKAKLFYKRKLISAEKEVRYMAMQLPDPAEIVAIAESVADTKKSTIDILEKFALKESQKFQISKDAIELEEAEKVFGAKVVIKLDKEFNEEFGYLVNKKRPTVVDDTPVDQNVVNELAEKMNIPEDLAVSLYKRNPEKILDLAKEVNFNRGELLKRLATA